MKQTAMQQLLAQLKHERANIPMDIEWDRCYQAIETVIVDVYLRVEKEQMCSFAEFVATYSDKNKNYLGEMLHAKSKYDGAERTVDLLEIFRSEQDDSRSI